MIVCSQCNAEYPPSFRGEACTRCGNKLPPRGRRLSGFGMPAVGSGQPLSPSAATPISTAAVTHSRPPSADDRWDLPDADSAQTPTGASVFRAPTQPTSFGRPRTGSEHPAAPNNLRTTMSIGVEEVQARLAQLRASQDAAAQAPPAPPTPATPPTGRAVHEDPTRPVNTRRLVDSEMPEAVPPPPGTRPMERASDANALDGLEFNDVTPQSRDAAMTAARSPERRPEPGATTPTSPIKQTFVGHALSDADPRRINAAGGPSSVAARPASATPSRSTMMMGVPTEPVQPRAPVAQPAPEAPPRKASPQEISPANKPVAVITDIGNRSASGQNFQRVEHVRLGREVVEVSQESRPSRPEEPRKPAEPARRPFKSTAMFDPRAELDSRPPPARAASAPVVASEPEVSEDDIETRKITTGMRPSVLAAEPIKPRQSVPEVAPTDSPDPFARTVRANAPAATATPIQHDESPRDSGIQPRAPFADATVAPAPEEAPPVAVADEAPPAASVAVEPSRVSAPDVPVALAATEAAPESFEAKVPAPAAEAPPAAASPVAFDTTVETPMDALPTPPTPVEDAPLQPVVAVYPPLISSEPKAPPRSPSPVLASEILREDLVPHEPGREQVRYVVALAGAVLVVAVPLSGTHDLKVLAGWIVAGLVSIALGLAPLRYPVRAVATAAVALPFLSWETLSNPQLSRPGVAMTVALLAVLPAALLFRSHFRASRRARAFIALGVGLGVLWALTPGAGGAFVPGDPWLRDHFAVVGLAPLLLLSLLGFMGSDTTAGRHVWAVLVVLWGAMLPTLALVNADDRAGAFRMIIGRVLATGALDALLAVSIASTLAVYLRPSAPRSVLTQGR